MSFLDNLKKESEKINSKFIPQPKQILPGCDAVLDVSHMNQEQINNMGNENYSVETDGFTAECARNLNKNGIELIFTQKPDAETLRALKNNGFFYSHKQNIWFKRYDDASFNIARNIVQNAYPERLDKQAQDDFASEKERVKEGRLSAYDLYKRQAQELMNLLSIDAADLQLKAIDELYKQLILKVN